MEEGAASENICRIWDGGVEVPSKVKKEAVVLLASVVRSLVKDRALEGVH